MAMASSSALQQPECCRLIPGAPRRRHLLRMLPPPLRVLPCRRGAVRFSSGDKGRGGSAGAVEKRSVPVPVPELAEEDGGEGEVVLEEAVDGGKLELRWPPWEGLPERYRLMGATSLAFVICNMEQLKESVHGFAQEHIAPHAAAIDSSNYSLKEVNLWKLMGDFILHGLTSPGGGSVQMAYAISEKDATKASQVSEGEDSYRTVIRKTAIV